MIEKPWGAAGVWETDTTLGSRRAESAGPEALAVSLRPEAPLERRKLLAPVLPRVCGGSPAAGPT